MKSIINKVMQTNKDTKNIKNFAIFSYLNQQFKVSVEDKIFIPFDKDLKEDQKILFNKVLVCDQKIGTPFLKNFKIEAKCLKTAAKDKKIIVFKYKSKKNYRVKTGHRQKWTMIQILRIFKDDIKKVTKKIDKKVKTDTKGKKQDV